MKIDITSGSENRFEVYADIGVPEIWRYDGNYLIINIFQNQKYIVFEQSLAFHNLPITEIYPFLLIVGKMDYLELVREFRSWVKSQIIAVKS